MEFVDDAPYVGGDNSPPVRIASMIVDPGNNEVERFRDSYTATATACAQPTTNVRVIWNGPAQFNTGNATLPVTEWGAFIFRDTIRYAVIYTPQPTLTADFTYRAVMDPDSATPYVQSFGGGGNQEIVDPAYMEYQASVSSWKAHGDYMGIGTYGDKLGIWIDATAGAPMTVRASFDAPSGGVWTSGVMSILAYRYDGGVWTPAFIASGTTSVQPTALAFQMAFTLASSGYYAFEVLNGALDGTSKPMPMTMNAFQIESNGSLGSVWSHIMVNDLFPGNILATQAIRILGSSAWLRNIAAPLLQQGTLVACQVNANEDWYTGYASSINPALYELVSGLATEEEFKLAEGYYGFLRPSGAHDFKFQSPSTFSGQNMCARFRLAPECDFLAIAASCNTAGGGDCTLKLDCALEYKTKNDWLELEKATVSEEDWKTAVEAVAAMKQHYKNDIHVSAILRSIGKALNLSGPVLSAFGPYGAALTPIASALGRGAIGLADGLEARKKRVRAIQAAEQASQNTAAKRRR